MLFLTADASLRSKTTKTRQYKQQRIDKRQMINREVEEIKLSK